jgi:molybdopterin synthase sulfur carrier subunit
MSVKLLYFASLRESLGTASEEINLPPQVADVAALRSHLSGRGEPWQLFTHNKNLRAAVNQDMADDGASVVDGDEIAFFPPVTGG